MAARASPQSIFIVTASCIMIIYGGTQISKRQGIAKTTNYCQNTSFQIQEKRPQPTKEKFFQSDVSQQNISKHRRKVVILLSNQRSGSSFVGDYFANNNNAFYLFEPLLPYGMNCSELPKERLNFLKNLSQCEFSTLVHDYKSAYNATGVKSHKECIRGHVCSLNKHNALLKRYSELCYFQTKKEQEYGNEPAHRSCTGNPVDLSLWSSLCRSSHIVAFKTLRICSLESLEAVSKTLADLGHDVYVIELVRDPRGIINSALKLELRLRDLDDRLDQICGRFSRNMDYAESQEKNGSGIVSEGRYMRMRFEDIAVDPMSAARKIYGFIGESIPKEVESWLNISTGDTGLVLQGLKQELTGDHLTEQERVALKNQIKRVTHERNSPYGTMRNSSNVPMKWRKTLSMGVIEKIQEKCGEVMTRFGYKMLRAKENSTTKLW